MDVRFISGVADEMYTSDETNAVLDGQVYNRVYCYPPKSQTNN